VPEGEQPAADGWLLLIYRVPPEPARLRSAVWRRLSNKDIQRLLRRRCAAASGRRLGPPPGVVPHSISEPFARSSPDGPYSA
jgi:hypothetical protein